MANYFDRFDENKKGDRANYFDRFDAPAESTETTSQLEALTEGALSGLSANFRDEIYGASEASGLPRALGGFRAPIGAARLVYEGLAGRGSATETYERARDEKRALQEALKREHPATSLIGELGGAVALPVGGMLSAATLPARMARGAGVGATYGGLAGFGEGENPTERLSRAATGASIGGIVGGLGVPAVEGVASVAGKLASPITNRLRGLTGVDDEAARRIGVMMERDVKADPSATSRMTAAEMAATPEARIVDLGGEGVRGLERSSANLSPDARAAFKNAFDERFIEQGDRLVGWLNNNFNFPNARTQQMALDASKRAANKQNYDIAKRDGAGGLYSDELGRLSTSDAVVAAMGRVDKRAGDESIAAGGGAADPTRMVTRRGPTLEYWDLVRRDLSNSAKVAKRSGDDEGARLHGNLARLMNEELDRLVPSYANARKTAAGFFDAEDALEAGKNFVHLKKNPDDARAAFLGMSQTEQKLFQDGFISKLIEDIRQIPDSRDVVKKIYNSTEARNRINMVLGGQKALELEAMLRIEGLMNLPREALGNSTTARQLVELGLAGSAGAAGGFALTGDPMQMGHGLIAVALTRGKQLSDARVANKIAEMLTSRDPAVLSRGVKMLAGNKNLMDRIRQMDNRIGSSISQQSNVAVGSQGVARAEDDEPK